MTKAKYKKKEGIFHFDISLKSGTHRAQPRRGSSVRL
jgi:hypothetical protein